MMTKRIMISRMGLGDEDIELFYEVGFLENTNEIKTPTTEKTQFPTSKPV